MEQQVEKHSELQVDLEVKQRWSTVSCRWSCRWSSQQWSSNDELRGDNKNYSDTSGGSKEGGL